MTETVTENSSKSNWYILNVMAGQENRIASELKSVIQSKKDGAIINDVVVPTKNQIKVKKGKKVQENQKIFPGYIFINAQLNSSTKKIINSIPKVMGFLGPKNKPQTVSEDKVKEIIKFSESQDLSHSDSNFEIGQMLNIIEGPFESFSGVVEEYDVEKKKVKISVSIFGRATSVELDVNQVEKV